MEEDKVKKLTLDSMEKIVRKVYNITNKTENRYPHKDYLENIEKEYDFIIRNKMYNN